MTPNADSGGHLPTAAEVIEESRCVSRFYGPKGCRARCSRYPHDDDRHWNGSQAWTTEAAERSRRRYQASPIASSGT